MKLGTIAFAAYAVMATMAHADFVFTETKDSFDDSVTASVGTYNHSGEKLVMFQADQQKPFGRENFVAGFTIDDDYFCAINRLHMKWIGIKPDGSKTSVGQGEWHLKKKKKDGGIGATDLDGSNMRNFWDVLMQSQKFRLEVSDDCSSRRVTEFSTEGRDTAFKQMSEWKAPSTSQ